MRQPLCEIEFLGNMQPLNKSNLRHIMNKVFAKFIAGSLGSFILGWGGLIIGAMLHPNYEAGGRIGLPIGVVIGSLIGVLLTKREKYNNLQYTIAILFSILLLVYVYYITTLNLEILKNQILMWGLVFLTPPLILTIAINWQKLFNHKSS
jgi:hypothetical protein